MGEGMDAEELRERLLQIDPYEFEDFVAELWEELGWNTTVSKSSRDQGVDIEARKSSDLVDQKAAIQVKRRKNTITRDEVQKYHSMKEQDREADMAVVVTTSRFSDGAKVWAYENNVKLFDGDDLVELIQKHERYDLVEEYAPERDGEEEQPEKSKPEKSKPEKSTSSASSSTESSVSPSSAKSGDYFVFVGIVFWAQVAGIGLAAFSGAVPAFTVQQGVILFAFAWMATPFVIFMDANEVHSLDTGYKPNRITWPILAWMLPVIVPLMYYNKRN